MVDSRMANRTIKLKPYVKTHSKSINQEFRLKAKVLVAISRGPSRPLILGILAFAIDGMLEQNGLER